MQKDRTIWNTEYCLLPNGQPCNECCFASAIPEIPKNDQIDCRYARENRCGIYPDRPDTCMGFKCSEEPNFTKDYLIDSAERRGKVSPEEAKLARDRIVMVIDC